MKKKDEMKGVRIVKNSEDAYNVVREPLVNEEQENLLMLSLNQGGVLKSIDWLSIGSDTQTVVSPKMIARKALISGACSVIMVHNHPSGNLKPSQEDLNSTERVRKALELIEVRLLDHIIVGGGGTGYYSMQDNGSM